MSARRAARTSLVADVRNRAFGVGFLVLLLFFGWLIYGIFNKSFVSYDDVILRTSKIGLQLPSRADVKIRGVRVGEVLSARAVAAARSTSRWASTRASGRSSRRT